MAAVKMKKLSLVCLKSDGEKLMEKLQRMQCAEITQQPPDGENKPLFDAPETRSDVSAAAEKADLYARSLASLSRHAPVKTGMFPQRVQIGEESAAALLASEEDTLAVCRDIERLEGEITEIRQRRTRTEALIEQLRPLEHFDLPLEQVADTAAAQIVLGFTHPSRLEELLEGAGEYTQFIEVGRTPDSVYLIMIAHRSAAEEAGALLSQAGFSRLTLRYQGTAAHVIAGFEAEMKKDDARNEAIAQEIAEHAAKRGDIQALCDLNALRMERIEAASRLGATREALLLTAWVPAGAQEKLEKELMQISPCMEIAFADPEEGESVPTYVQNNAFITPYESITNMFSTPSGSDIDPAPYLMPFFVCFFGMMVSDGAYGIIISLIGLLGAYVIKFRGMMGQICKVLIVGGLFTTFWGALFGGWFGIEGIEAPLFSPMYEPIMMLGLCFGLGLVHVVFGMALKMVMAFKAGDWQTAVFDQIGWMLLILCGVAAGGGAALGVSWLATIGAVGAIAGALMILLFAGRDQKFGVGRIVSGLGSLYGVTSYLSDVLSYARLFAMGLATGVICMVFNTIAGLLLGSPVGFIFGIAVLIVGHGFNLAINALGAYVHSCRLQYIEFFGKFFEGGGRAFKPLMRSTKYVDFTK